jgi:hypothetical protein
MYVHGSMVVKFFLEILGDEVVKLCKFNRGS